MNAYICVCVRMCAWVVRVCVREKMIEVGRTKVILCMLKHLLSQNFYGLRFASECFKHMYVLYSC